MAHHRTTLLLDAETREAARELARRYDCSVSEAIRRSVVRQRNAELGPHSARRLTRRRALQRAFRLFQGNDAAAEIRRLKAQDAGF
jgi:hypothetical protein